MTVNHLAAAYVAFASPNGTACRAVNLTISVTAPEGVTTAPAFARRGAPAMPLVLNGSTATATVPWSTCGSLKGTLAVPNTTATSDAANFTISAALSAPTPAPAPQPTPQERNGDGLIAPSELAPEVDSVRGPATVRVSRARPKTITIVLHSSRAGAIDISVFKRFIDLSGGKSGVVEVSVGKAGTSAFQEFRLRRGTNRLRVRLAKGFRPGRYHVTLDPYSTGDQANEGLRLVRSLRVKRGHA